jgi:hypothetical protein
VSKKVLATIEFYVDESDMEHLHFTCQAPEPILHIIEAGGFDLVKRLNHFSEMSRINNEIH